MKQSLRIEIVPLVFYLLLLTFSFFLSVTVGGPLSALAAFFFFLLVLDLGQVAWTYMQLFQSETFSGDHPVKGEILTHIHTLEAGKLPLRSCRMDLEFQFAGPLSVEDRKNLTLWLRPKALRKTESSYKIRHRGVYSLGLARFSFRSWTGWIRFDMPLWPKTFYVRPRIIPLKAFPLVPHKESLGAVSHQRNPWSDPAVFDHVVPYRPGMSLKGADYRRLANGGEPVIRQFLPETWIQAKIGLDTHRPETFTPEEGEGILESEDLVLEACGTICRYLVNQGVSVQLWSWDRPFLPWTLNSEDDLASWVDSAVSLEFSPAPSLAQLWDSNHLSQAGEGGIFFSHRPDPQLWSWLEKSPGENFLFTLTAGWTLEKLSLWHEMREPLERSGCKTWTFASLEELEAAGAD